MTSELAATALLDAVETNHWMMNDPGVGAHRYYHDDWYCIALATGDGRWSATVLHSGEGAGGLVHDVREEERFNVTIPDEDAGKRAFASVAALADFIVEAKAA